MPFDAGFTAAVTKEIADVATGARIDKIYQPERDIVVLSLKSAGESKKLLLSAVAGMSRFGFTDTDRENPAEPPMFCMLLRKHLVGGHIMFVKQLGFERAVEIGISSHDEMGFKSEKSLIVEIMGTYSNIILLDEKRRVLSAIRFVDLSVKAKRQILPGFPYELPPVQEGKLDTLSVTKEEFMAKLERDISEGFGENAPVDVVVRPEDVYIIRNAEAAMFHGVVRSCVFKGVHYEMFVETPDGYEIQIQDYNCFEPGTEVGMMIKPADIHVMRKERTENVVEGVVVDANHVEILGETFECQSVEGAEAGETIDVHFDFSAVELHDDPDDGISWGTIRFILYKGDRYHLTIRTEEGDDVYVDTRDVWEDLDEVGITIAPAALRVTRRAKE